MTIPNTISLKKSIVIFFISRLFYSVFAIFVFSKFTQLGDTLPYLHSNNAFQIDTLWSSTKIMYSLGEVFKKIFVFDILTCIPFCLLSTYSYSYIFRYFSKISKAQKIIIMLVFYSPSFGIWTSICSKEAISVFYFSILGVFLCQVLDKTKKFPNFIEILSFYLCLIFKPLLFIPLIQFYLIIITFGKNKFLQFITIFTLIILNILFLKYFSDEINTFVNNIFSHFSSGNSTRENIWTEENDYIRKFYIAMPLSFIGPVLSDILKSPIQILFTLESLILIYILFLPSIRKIIYLKKKTLINALIAFFIFSLLYFNSFQGALNPGSGLRYRENIIVLITIMVLYIKQKKKKVPDINKL